MPEKTRLAGLRREWLLPICAATAIAMAIQGETWLHQATSPLFLAALFGWLFGTILAAALAVVRHAEAVAHRVGEPFGTIILTLSITAIEVVSISAVMLHEPDPTLTRDTLFAVIMILMNGMIGLALLAGGWKHREQFYNLQGANAYLSVIVPLAALGLVLPDFTQSTPGPTLSISQQVFMVVVSLGLYGIFLALQAGRHAEYFQDVVSAEQVSRSGGLWGNVILLIGYLAPVVFLAEQLSKPLQRVVHLAQAPVQFAGVIVAILVATPEAIGAVRAALANRMQRAMNIFLGSVLSTIGLTVPAMVVVSRVLGRDLILGVENANLVVLILTLVVSIITFTGGRTNILQGAVHLILFAAYLLLLVHR